MRVSSWYHSYDDYLRHQLNKTADPLLRRVWATNDWRASLLSIARSSSQHLHPPPFPQIHIRSSPVVTFDLICSTFNKSRSLSRAPLRDFLTGNRHRKRIAWVSSRLVWIVLVQPTIIGDEDKENDTIMEYFNKEDINHFNIDVARTI
jgi:hypothetical protein